MNIRLLGLIACFENRTQIFCKFAFMTTNEIKSEIQKTLDGIPENVLQEILDYLKEVQGKSVHKMKLGKNLRDILVEDRELLERLAK